VAARLLDLLQGLDLVLFAVNQVVGVSVLSLSLFVVDDDLIHFTGVRRHEVGRRVSGRGVFSGRLLLSATSEGKSGSSLLRFALAQELGLSGLRNSLRSNFGDFGSHFWSHLLYFLLGLLLHSSNLRLDDRLSHLLDCFLSLGLLHLLFFIVFGHLLRFLRGSGLFFLLLLQLLFELLLVLRQALQELILRFQDCLLLLLGFRVSSGGLNSGVSSRGGFSGL